MNVPIPTISLCIPAYNAAWCLPRLLDSANRQKIKFDEILIYNDCSTDKTSEVAKQYGAIVIEGKKNLGCSYAKNKLLEYAKSVWIHFHDADDELLPNFTILAHQWIATENCPDVVLFDYEVRENETSKLINIRHFDPLALAEDPVRYAIKEQINPFCGLYRKEKILISGGYIIDREALYNEDVAFHIKLAVNGLSFGADSEVSIINYMVPNSMSNANLHKCALAQHYVMKKLSENIAPKYKIDIARKLWGYAKISASLQDWKLTRNNINLAIILGGRKAIGESRIFTALSVINPFYSFWLREKLIRRFKPSLRNE